VLQPSREARRFTLQPAHLAAAAAHQEGAWLVLDFSAGRHPPAAVQAFLAADMQEGVALRAEELASEAFALLSAEAQGQLAPRDRHLKRMKAWIGGKIKGWTVRASWSANVSDSLPSPPLLLLYADGGGSARELMHKHTTRGQFPIDLQLQLHTPQSMLAAGGTSWQAESAASAHDAAVAGSSSLVSSSSSRSSSSSSSSSAAPKTRRLSDADALAAAEDLLLPCPRVYLHLRATHTGVPLSAPRTWPSVRLETLAERLFAPLAPGAPAAAVAQGTTAAAPRPRPPAVPLLLLLEPAWLGGVLPGTACDALLLLGGVLALLAYAVLPHVRRCVGHEVGAARAQLADKEE
jgi:hypothetical protein